jgi:hypothetical protein
MLGLLIGGLLGIGALAADDKPSAKPVWLKDYAQAKAKALRENKPIFVVFR